MVQFSSFCRSVIFAVSQSRTAKIAKLIKKLNLGFPTCDFADAYYLEVVAANFEKATVTTCGNLVLILMPRIFPS